jgi:hypothetical protein
MLSEAACKVQSTIRTIRSIRSISEGGLFSDSTARQGWHGGQYTGLWNGATAAKQGRGVIQRSQQTITGAVRRIGVVRNQSGQFWVRTRSVIQAEFSL